MSILDIIIALVVLGSLWRGFRAGAMKTALALLSWLIALVTASKMAHSAQPLVVSVTDNPVLQLALAFLLVSLLVLVFLQLLVYVSSKALKALKLDLLDKIAGGVLGAGVGLLKVLVVLSLTAPILSHFAVWERSLLAQNLLPLAPMAKTLLAKSAGEVWQVLDEP